MRHCGLGTEIVHPMTISWISSGGGGVFLFSIGLNRRSTSSQVSAGMTLSLRDSRKETRVSAKTSSRIVLGTSGLKLPSKGCRCIQCLPYPANNSDRSSPSWNVHVSRLNGQEVPPVSYCHGGSSPSCNIPHSAIDRSM